MAEHWASVDRQFEEVHAARRHAQALEDAALASWDGYLELSTAAEKSQASGLRG